MATDQRVILYAPTVHQGGGLVLLKTLLPALNANNDYAILDDRLPAELKHESHIKTYFRKNTLLGRLQAERHLAKVAQKNDIVICFGNLPPLFKLNSQDIVLFMQNPYLVYPVQFSGVNLRFALNIFIQRTIFKLRCPQIRRYIVQTNSMCSALQALFVKQVNITTLALMSDIRSYFRRGNDVAQVTSHKKYDFIYVASGEPHKNHKALIDAWCILAEENIYPSLALTLAKDKFSELLTYCEQKKQKFSLKIENLGTIPHQQVMALYKDTRALIYPSLFESFGLPLIEARQQETAIVAAELNYVRDLVDPEQTFDPRSAISIARSVKRFLNVSEAALSLLDGKQLLTDVIHVKQS